MGNFLYESPITLSITDKVQTDLRNAYEQHIMCLLQRMNINVDKEELIQALQYDRDQYRKGYNDALSERVGKWIPKDDEKWHCNLCDGIAPKGIKWRFCPHCGARMEDNNG